MKHDKTWEGPNAKLLFGYFFTLNYSSFSGHEEFWAYMVLHHPKQPMRQWKGEQTVSIEGSRLCLNDATQTYFV